MALSVYVGGALLNMRRRALFPSVFEKKHGAAGNTSVLPPTKTAEVFRDLQKECFRYRPALFCHRMSYAQNLTQEPPHRAFACTALGRFRACLSVLVKVSSVKPYQVLQFVLYMSYEI